MDLRRSLLNTVEAFETTLFVHTEDFDNFAIAGIEIIECVLQGLDIDAGKIDFGENGKVYLVIVLGDVEVIAILIAYIHH